jgi:hypothetical protein
MSGWQPELAALFAFADDRLQPWPEPVLPDEPLADVGLLRLGATPYPDTPGNAVPLLRSGVDGVHWSALPAQDAPAGYVVVMTVPGALSPNHVVGESIREFLALGCESAYFDLIMLAYDYQAHLSARQDEPAKTTLTGLREGLALMPWTDLPGRLEALRKKYGFAPPR